MPRECLSDVALGQRYLLPAQQVQHHTQVDYPRQAPQPLPKYGRPYGYRTCLLSGVQHLAHVKPVQKALHT